MAARGFAACATTLRVVATPARAALRGAARCCVAAGRVADMNVQPLRHRLAACSPCLPPLGALRGTSRRANRCVRLSARPRATTIRALSRAVALQRAHAARVRERGAVHRG